MEFFDSHCHLDLSRYGEDRPAVIERAREAGVTRLTQIGAGGSLDVCREAIALAESTPGITATVGYHPHDASKVTEGDWPELERLALHPKVVAVGETGLDFHYDHSPRDVQREVFARFIDLARRVKKPLVIHNRDSDADCIKILDSENAGEVGGVVHCFSSGMELARKALDIGFYLGFTGIASFKNAKGVHEAVIMTPLDRILIETDSPYLAPVPFRGKRNEPARVVHVAHAIAKLKGVSVEEVADQTTANARALYGSATDLTLNDA